jgi:phosphoribosylglycinamide formyltransferase-1
MKSLIIFASGSGSNAAAIIQHFKQTNLAQVQLIVCNKPNAGVIDIAQQHQIPYIIIDKAAFNEDTFINTLSSYSTDLIVLAGFLWKIPDNIIKAFSNKIINIHPSLLPKYGGKGMFGKHVHEAVIAGGEQESGITIHMVNEHYDEGAHIVQAHCAINSQDDAQSLAQKIHQLEHYFFPRTIEYILSEQ